MAGSVGFLMMREKKKRSEKKDGGFCVVSHVHSGFIPSGTKAPRHQVAKGVGRRHEGNGKASGHQDISSFYSYNLIIHPKIPWRIHEDISMAFIPCASLAPFPYSPRS